MGHISWTDVVLHGWTHNSGEFGERVYHVRRVRLTDAGTLEGLARVEKFSPEDDWAEYEWCEFDFLPRRIAREWGYYDAADEDAVNNYGPIEY